MSPEIRRQVQLAALSVNSTRLSTLADQFIEYTAKHCAKSTLPSRRSRIAKLVNFLDSAGIYDIEHVNNAVLSIFFDQYSLDTKTSSVNAMRKTVKSFIAWMEGYKEMSTNVRAQSIALEKEGKRNPRYLESDDVERLINDRSIQYVDRMLIVIGFKMGLRASEMASIRMSDITSDQLDVIGKCNQERVVTIPAVVSSMIESYVTLAPYPLHDDGYLFQVYWRGEWRPMNAKTIWRRLKAIFTAKLNNDQASPHWLRHSYAVDLLMRGCDLVTIQKSLGHVDIKVTQRYLNISDSLVSDNIHKFLG